MPDNYLHHHCLLRPRRSSSEFGSTRGQTSFLLYQPNLAVADVPDALRSILPQHQPNIPVADDLGAHRLTLLSHQSNLAAADSLDALSVSLPTASRHRGTPVEDELFYVQSRLSMRLSGIQFYLQSSITLYS